MTISKKMIAPALIALFAVSGLAMTPADASAAKKRVITNFSASHDGERETSRYMERKRETSHDMERERSRDREHDRHGEGYGGHDNDHGGNGGGYGGHDNDHGGNDNGHGGNGRD